MLFVVLFAISLAVGVAADIWFAERQLTLAVKESAKLAMDEDCEVYILA